MMFICPNCKSKILTPTGVELDSVECGNCGTIIAGAHGIDVSDKGAPGCEITGGSGSLLTRIIRWFRRS
jgi:ribosomal protein S27E